MLICTWDDELYTDTVYTDKNQCADGGLLCEPVRITLSSIPHTSMNPERKICATYQ